MTIGIKCMLAGKFEEERIALLLERHKFLYTQPKIDGFRIICWEGDARSRSWKLWTNKYLQAWASDFGPLTHGMDGEFFVGHEYTPTGFRDTMSGGRAEDGASTLGFYWFDLMDAHFRDFWYKERFDEIGRRVAELNDGEDEIQAGCGDQSLPFHMKHHVIPMERVTTLEDIYEAERDYLAAGWEGLMIRTPIDPYKFGRGTPAVGPLIKLKRFADAEAIIDGFIPRYRNDNPADTSALGYTVRTSHQDNLVELDELGAMEVHLAEFPDVHFKIGVFRADAAYKAKIWAARDRLIGTPITFLSQDYSGGYDVPRTPVWKCFRNAIEL